MKSLITIQFGKLAAGNYQKAIQIAKQFSHFSPASARSEKNTLKIFRNELNEKHRKLKSLWAVIGRWKSTEVFIDKDRVSFRKVRKFIDVVVCGENYYKAVIQKDYCRISSRREGWGCRFLTQIGRHLPEHKYFLSRDYGYWFQFGHFVKPSVWVIDKEGLKAALRREADQKQLGLCPIFKFRAVDRVVKELPDRIDLDNSDNWVIRYGEDDTGETLEKKAIGIMPRHFKYDKAFGTSTPIKDERPSDNGEKKKSLRRNRRYIPAVRFKDIGGIDDIIQTIREVIELPLKRPKLLKYLGVRPHKGVLLHGAPGCGKTLIAKAIANEVNAHFISIKGPELLSKWHGQSEQNFRDIFDEARRFQPSIIYFDEIDSVAQKRSGEEHLRSSSQVVTQLLTLMDGAEDYSNVCVIGSTNRKELIDEALLRPGRFDYSLEVKMPTRQGCYKIFRICTKNMPISKRFNAKKFSRELEGLSGADIAFVASEGAYNCLRRNADVKSLVQTKDPKELDFKKFVIKEEDFMLALKRKKAGMK